MTTGRTTPAIRAAGVVFVVALVVYANTLVNGFVVDDVHQILENDWITGIGNLPDIFSRGVWDFEGRTSSYYRPLMHASYMATWYVVGRAPWGYHLVNVLLHAGASLLVFAVVHRLMERRDAERRASMWLNAPFVAGLLFAVHPIHTEAVAWVAGITDVSMTFFCLLSLWLYLGAEEQRRLALLLLASLSFFLATLCKETGAAFPLVLLAYEATLAKDGWRTLRVVGRLAPFAVAGVLYLALRVHALGGFAPTAASAQLSGSQYALAVLALLAGYTEKLVLPINQNFWSVFVPPASLASAAALRALAVTSAAVVTGWLAARRSRMAFFGLALVLIPLLPAFHISALNQGLENALAERYLYFPSVGFVLLLGLAASKLCERASPRLVVPALALVAGTFAAGTIQRNTVWKDELRLWTDVVSKSPKSAMARKNYGAALIYSGRKTEGEHELRAAITLRPDLVDQELAKGAAYGARGLSKKAVLAFHMALALDPRNAPAHFALGVTYERRGWLDAAIGEYEAALALRPDYAEAHNNVGTLYAQRGMLDRARPHFESAVRLRPEDEDYRSNLERARRLGQR